MKDELFIEKLIRRIAQISVGSSALRNQGAKGIIDICRDYFENYIDLNEFRSNLESKEYIDYLDNNTSALLSRFPAGGKSWGAARKGLNLFFREVVYNLYLAKHLNIPIDFEENKKALKYLEIPLDKDVASGLMEKCSGLEKWESIKSLTSEESEVYQTKAFEYAEELNIPRIHLDLKFWRSKNTNI